MINYIIEASVCLACFYSIYWLFLRKEKLLSLNRFYLLSTAAISLIIPLLNIETAFNIFPKAAVSSQPILRDFAATSQSASTSSPLLSIGLVYLIGLAIATFLLAFKVTYAKRKIGKKITLKPKPIEVAETEGLAAFSFLNTIFIGKDLSHNSELKAHIIAHESAHIEGRHSLDLFFFEMLKCVFWFNPFSYLYCRSIKLQHEYIADQHALEVTNPASYQRSLLELTLSQVNSSLISNFNEHPIETRLKMIQKLNSNVMNKLKTLFAVPVLALLFVAFACTETAEPEAEELEFIELEVEKSDDSNPLIIDESYKNRLYTVIDSMRAVEGKFKYNFRFDTSEGENEIHEIATTEIEKARFILRGLEEVREQKGRLIQEYKNVQEKGQLLEVTDDSGKNVFELVVEEKPKSSFSYEADKVLLVNPDGTKKH